MLEGLKGWGKCRFEGLTNLPWRVVGYDLVVVVPEDVCRWLRGVGDGAGQVNHGPAVHVQVRGALDPHVGNCNGQRGLRGELNQLAQELKTLFSLA